MTLGAQGADFGRHRIGRADGDGLGLGFQPRKHGILDAALHDMTRTCDTALPCGSKDSRHLGIGSTIQIGIVKDDEGRFPAQFQRGFRQVFRTGPHDMARGFRPPGKGDMGDLWVSGQRHAGLWPAGQNIDHACGKSRLMHQFCELQQGRGAILAGLQNHRATCGQSGAQFHRRQEKLRIPRHDGGHHAHGFAPQPNLHIGLVDGQMRAFDLVGKSGIIAIVFRDIGDLSAGFANDLAGIAGFQGGQTRGRRLHQIGELIQEFAARRGRQPRPFAAEKRAICGIDRPINVGGRGVGHGGPSRARCRVKAVKLRGAVFERAVDIVLEMVHMVLRQRRALHRR